MHIKLLFINISLFSQNLTLGSGIFLLLRFSNFNSVFMSISTTLLPRTDYHFFYNFLLVMSEEQIQKLRRIILGFEKISSFSENEIKELEKKVAHK